jgi:hypothetical protein
MNLAELRAEHNDLCHCNDSTCACPTIIARDAHADAPAICDDCAKGKHTNGTTEDYVLNAMIAVREELAAAQCTLNSGAPCIVVEAARGIITGVRTRGLPKGVDLFQIDYDDFEGADRASIEKLEQTIDEMFD